MKNGYFWVLFMLPFLVMSTGCGKQAVSDEGLQQRQEEQWPDGPLYKNFQGLLSDSLSISGTVCNGGEVTTQENQVFTCEVSQWLVTINYGRSSQTIIADLKMAPIPTPDSVKFYYIRASIPTADQNIRTLRKVWVRFDLNSTPKVLYRPGF